jgi:hypothetical protein
MNDRNFLRNNFTYSRPRWDLHLQYLLTELSPSWEAGNFTAIQEIPSNFKELEGSSPCSQEPSSTGPYPKPVRSSPYHPILSQIFGYRNFYISVRTLDFRGEYNTVEGRESYDTSRPTWHRNTWYHYTSCLRQPNQANS